MIAIAAFASGLLIWFLYWVIHGRFHESTDDAYVNGNMILITPQQPGIVTMLLADNTQIVEPGQPLALLDRHDYALGLEQAQANLASAVRDVVQLFLTVEELKAKQAVALAHYERAKLDCEHRSHLVGDGSVSLEEFQHSELTFAAAAASFEEVAREMEKAMAEVAHTTVSTHPRVEQKKAELKTAFLGLHRCTIRAPVRGIITQRSAQVGQWTRANDPLMALVPLDQIWVDANCREVSLKHVRMGQPVELFSDMYGRGETFHGVVVGLNPGTGSVFSILPPQNATGNWIKIVQRVPIKISLDLDEIKVRPLLLGLSMTAVIDTHERSRLRVPHSSLVQPIYSTEIYTDELQGVEEMIAQIIAQNG